MKKSAILAAALTLFVVTGAIAEQKTEGHEVGGHKLLVTDVPDPGQLEARLDYIYSYAHGKNDLEETIKDEKSAGSVSLAAGIVKGLKISASLPYTFVQHQENVKVVGWNDLVLGIRYSLAKSGLHLPIDLAAGIDWQMNSASTKSGKPGSGMNTYSPYMAVSKQIEMVIPYFKYQPDFSVKQDHNRTNHNLTAGVELECSHGFSMDLSAKTTFNGEHEGIKATSDVEFELMPYINVAKNIYLLPRIAYKLVGDSVTADNIKLSREVGEFKTGVGLYLLF